MFIEFGEINCKYLILAIFPLFYPFRKIVYENINDNHFFDIFRFYLSYILSFIFILIIKKRTGKESTQIGTDDTNNNNIEGNELEKSKWINPLKAREEMERKVQNKKKIIYTLLLTLIGLSTSLFYAIFRTVHEVNDEKSIKFINEIDIGKQSIGSFFEIVFFSIFGKLILKNKIYKHHVVSLIIMLFNLIFYLLFMSVILKLKLSE